MGRPNKFQAKTEKQFEDALRANGGVYVMAAKALGVTRLTVAAHVEKSPHLQAIVKESDEGNLDVAETSLMRAVVKGEAWAICFFLKCKGKARGYVERQEFSGVNGGPIESVSAVKEMSDEQLAKIAGWTNADKPSCSPKGIAGEVSDQGSPNPPAPIS